MSISPGSVSSIAPLNVPVVMSAPDFSDVLRAQAVIGVIDEPGEDIAFRMLCWTIIDLTAGMGDLERRAADGVDNALFKLRAEHIAAIAEAVGDEQQKGNAAAFPHGADQQLGAEIDSGNRLDHLSAAVRNARADGQVAAEADGDLGLEFQARIPGNVRARNGFGIGMQRSR